MEFKFDPSEPYQTAAIEAVVGLFEGQALVRSQLVIPKGASFQVVPNRLDIGDDVILANLSKVQAAQGISADAALQTLSAEIDTLGGKAEARFGNFSVEMETGTGK